MESPVRIKLHSCCEWQSCQPQCLQVWPLLQFLPSPSLWSTASDTRVSELSHTLLLPAHWPMSSGRGTLLACCCPPLCSGSVTLQTCCHLVSLCCQEKERAGTMTLVLKTLSSSQISESCNTGKKGSNREAFYFLPLLLLSPYLPSFLPSVPPSLHPIIPIHLVVLPSSLAPYTHTHTSKS